MSPPRRAPEDLGDAHASVVRAVCSGRRRDDAREIADGAARGQAGPPVDRRYAPGPMDVLERFARLTTDAVAPRPWLWPLFRAPLRWMFDAIAPRWDANRSAARTAAFEAGLGVVVVSPRRAIDIGTGTGDVAIVIARRWPQVEVLGVDFSKRMVAEARAKTPAELRERLRFDAADARRLPIRDGSFDLVGLNNMIPFFDELARITAPGGYLVVAFARGAQTPIYVPTRRIRAEVERRGFTDIREVSGGPGTAIVARRRGK
jgi:SAM-dependent methyltransferase